MNKFVICVFILVLGCSRPTVSYDCGEINLFTDDVSQYVVEGSVYEATIYWTGIPENIEIQVFADEKILTPNKEGEFKIEVPATLDDGETVGNGVVKKEFSIELRDSVGGLISVKKFEYYVVKPALVINHLLDKPLIVNCQNLIQVDIPGLSGNYDPSYKVVGSQLIQSSKSEIILVPDPNADQVELIVHNNGLEVGRRIFEVHNIPNLTVDLRSESGYIKGLSISAEISLLKVEVNSTEGFGKNFRKDNNFNSELLRLLHYRDGLLIQEKDIEGDEIQIQNLSLLKGDVLGIEVLDVLHKNFQSEEMTIKMQKNLRVLMVAD